MKIRLVALSCACVLLASACGTDGTTEPGPDTSATQDTVSTGDVAVDSGGSADTSATADVPDVAQTDSAVADATDSTASDSTASDSTASDSTASDSTASDAVDAGDLDATQVDTLSADTPDTAQADSAQPPVDAGALDKVSEHSKACSTGSDCTIPCATGTCNQGKCDYDVGGGCVVPVGADKVACYPAGAPKKDAPCLTCKPEVSQTSLTSVTELVPFEKTDEGWAVVDVSGSGIKWGLSDKRTAGGKMSLYLGDPKSSVYANDKHVKASVTTPAMTIPTNDGVKASLHFSLYLDTEETKGYDFLTVQVLEDKAGATAEALWHSDSIGGTTHKVWQMQKIDVSKWGGKKVKFVFTFDTLDGFVNAFEGAYIDELSIRTGCCGGGGDCDDGNACSTDACAPTTASKGLPVCGHVVTKACCSSSADCDDGKPCTLDLCSGPGGSCSHSAKPGCCMTTGDCDDKDACTIDHCPKAGSNCQHTNTCCKTDNECTSADTCLTGKCAGGDCAFTNICCSKDNECDDFNPCTIDACDKGQCLHSPSKAPGCCAVEPIVYEFDSDMEGWTSDAKLANGLVWHKGKYKGTATEAENGNGVLKFGVAGTDTFDKVSGSFYLYTTSPVIELTPGQQYTIEIKMKFAMNYKTSSNYLYQYYLVDGAQITSYYNYSQQEYYYVNHTTDDWVIWQKDISAFAGRKFQIKLRGRIYGYSSNLQSGQGTVIDYIKIKTSCNIKKCADNATCTPASTSCQGGKGICNEGGCVFAAGCCKSSTDCVSPTLCSVGTCSGSTCTFKEKANCCMGAGDCDDSNPCTQDACPGAGQQCTHTPVPGCCLAASECDDKQKCTSDECVLNKCKHQDICCKADSECNDKDDKCTTDKCGSDSFCQFTPTGAAGCCEPNLWTNIFSTSLQNMVIKNSQGAAKGWQLWTTATLSKSPTGVLYYGSPSAKNYNFGASNGTATTPEMALPAGKTTTLSLWLYQATESGTSYDKTYIYLIDATGKKTQLWYKGTKGFSTNKWLELSFDLKEWAGQKVTVQFLFDTNDSVSNSTLGVLIDDLKFTVKCD